MSTWRVADCPADAGGNVDAARLLRLEATLGALVQELRSLPQGSVDGAWLARQIQQHMHEAKTVAPPVLRPELQRLVKPIVPEADTDGDCRIVLAGLNGWVQGLTTQLGIVVDPPAVERRPRLRR